MTRSSVNCRKKLESVGFVCHVVGRPLQQCRVARAQVAQTSTLDCPARLERGPMIASMPVTRR